MLISHITIYKGLFRLRWEEGGVKGSKVELVKNKLILRQFYFTLPQSKWNHKEKEKERTFGILVPPTPREREDFSKRPVYYWRKEKERGLLGF